MAPPAARLTLGLGLLAAGAAAAKDPDTIVFAAIGDWGWGLGSNNTLLTADLSAACKGWSLGNESVLKACMDGDKVSQGMLLAAGRQQVPQLATASAMAKVCKDAGDCDFFLSLGDNFYDLGIIKGLSDPQFANSFEQVYTEALFGKAPFLNTLGNHDYSILAEGRPGENSAVQAQIDYAGVNPRWVLPARNYDRTFSSASGAVKIQAVSMDSTPLHDRYLFSGATGGGFASTPRGMDTIPNANDRNAVLNPGVTVENGWPAGGNLFNASNFVCRYDWQTAKYLAGCSPSNSTTKACIATHKASGCKYAAWELGKYAAPAARLQTYDDTAARFRNMSGKVQYQVLFTHFPILSTQQRLEPYHSQAKAMLAGLGKDAPQAVFSGHDHIAGLLHTPELNDTYFVQAGNGGIADGPLDFARGLGMLTDDAALRVFVEGQYKPPPPPGVAGSSKSNPDVNFTKFLSDHQGFVLVTVNKTHMKLDYYFVNCTRLFWTGECESGIIGPVFSSFRAAKALAPTTTTTTMAASTTAKRESGANGAGRTAPLLASSLLLLIAGARRALP